MSTRCFISISNHIRKVQIMRKPDLQVFAATQVERTSNRLQEAGTWVLELASTVGSTTHSRKKHPDSIRASRDLLQVAARILRKVCIEQEVAVRGCTQPEKRRGPSRESNSKNKQNRMCAMFRCQPSFFKVHFDFRFQFDVTSPERWTCLL